MLAGRGVRRRCRRHSPSVSEGLPRRASSTERRGSSTEALVDNRAGPGAHEEPADWEEHQLATPVGGKVDDHPGDPEQRNGKGQRDRTNRPRSNPGIHTASSTWSDEPIHVHASGQRERHRLLGRRLPFRPEVRAAASGGFPGVGMDPFDGLAESALPTPEADPRTRRRPRTHLNPSRVTGTRPDRQILARTSTRPNRAQRPRPRTRRPGVPPGSPPHPHLCVRVSEDWRTTPSQGCGSSDSWTRRSQWWSLPSTTVRKSR